MVSPTVYRGLILKTPQVVYAPAKLEKCHLMKGLENESQLEIVGTQIRGLCKSICGSSESGRQFTAIKSELDEMKADHSISLEKTSAKTIRLTKGSLTIKSCKLAYEKLTAPRIVASDIASIKIHCKELDASLCTFTSVRSGVKSKMTDSVGLVAQ